MKAGRKGRGREDDSTAGCDDELAALSLYRVRQQELTLLGILDVHGVTMHKKIHSPNTSLERRS